MTVYLQKDRNAYTFEFEYQKVRYKGNTGQITKEAALAFEFKERDRARRTAAGLTDIRDAPAFAEWAGVYYTYKATSRHKVKRPDEIDFLIRTVLKFWGRKPTKDTKVTKVDPEAPYHDLTLADPVLHPEWLERFERWMTNHGYSGSHKNHLRTQISGMYKVAALPEHRAITGIEATTNPMLGVPRDRNRPRTASLTPAQIQAWIAAASDHVRLAIAIAVLAPKLRLGNILALQWQDCDRELTRIVVADHKTVTKTGRPLVVMISKQLRTILKAARKKSATDYVIAYQKHRVKSIRDGVKAAAERAKPPIPYGRGAGEGVTFHTIRHAVATWFAEMPDVSEPMRSALLAHDDIATTQLYTHMRPNTELKPLEQLSAKVKLAGAVNQPWGKWRGDRKNDPPKSPRKPRNTKRPTKRRMGRSTGRKAVSRY